MRTSVLTDTAIRKAKAQEKSYKLTDSNGLHLFVATTGVKIWRYRYYFGGKEKLLGLGQYPDVTLFEARRLQDDARTLIKNGKDYKTIEKRCEAAILRRFGVTITDALEIKRADVRMLATERRDLLPWNGEDWSIGMGVDPYCFDIIPWSPESAAIAFLTRFDELRGEAHG